MTVKKGPVRGQGQAGGSCCRERAKETAQVLRASAAGQLPAVLPQQALIPLFLLPVLHWCKPTRQLASDLQGAVKGDETTLRQ